MNIEIDSISNWRSPILLFCQWRAYLVFKDAEVRCVHRSHNCSAAGLGSDKDRREVRNARFRRIRVRNCLMKCRCMEVVMQHVQSQTYQGCIHLKVTQAVCT